MLVRGAMPSDGTFRGAFAAAIALWVCGCGSLPPLVVTPVERPTVWTPCAWDEARGDRDAECASIAVPLHYAADDSRRHHLFVKRRPAQGPTTAQVWLVTGGPGDAATRAMENLSGGIHRERPAVAHYAFDHRGTGRSERLQCPGLEGSATSILTPPAAVEACGADLAQRVGDRLDHVTVTASAHDLALLVSAHREPDVPVFVYGASYGTILLQRYMELYPDQADGVILEAIGVGRFLDGYDEGMERVGRRLMGLCAADPACAGRVDDDPWAVAQRAVASLDKGACEALGATSAQARVLLGAMLFYAPLRNLIPATVLRLDRCRRRDARALAHLVRRLESLVADPFSSDVAGAHVFLSETQPPERRAAPLMAAFSRATISTGLEAQMARVRSWPRSPGRGIPQRPPRYDGPILMLQGGLDGPTPIERARVLRDAYRGRGQTFVEFPLGAHGMTGMTPTSAGRDCARDIRIQFIDDPTRRPDLDCVSRILPIAWDGTPELNRYFFGVADAWGK
ncbi:MAG: alpha/beta hydrolase [Pseudomonadota bacterium]